MLHRDVSLLCRSVAHWGCQLLKVELPCQQSPVFGPAGLCAYRCDVAIAALLSGCALAGAPLNTTLVRGGASSPNLC